MDELTWGLAFTFATGFLWGGVGILYSRGTEKKDSFYGFMFLSSLFLLAMIWTFAFPKKAPLQEILQVAAIMLPAGISGQLGFFAMKKAMEYGPHGIGWCIVQSSMICPFLAGLLFFGDNPSGGRIAGMVLVAAALIPLSAANNPVSQKHPASKKFFLLIVSAFLLVGMQQTLSIIPSQMPGLSAEALSWRVPLVCLSGLAWLAPIAFRKAPLNPGGIWKLSLFYSLFVFLGQLGIYRAIDFLGKAHSSGTAYPAACGMSVVLFFVYCFFKRRETPSRAVLAGIVLSMAGMFLLSIS